MMWEYKTIKLQSGSFFVGNKPSFESIEVDKLLNELGEKGWEFVSSESLIAGDFEYTQTNTIILFFKRPLAK